MSWDDLDGVLEEIQLATEDMNEVALTVQRSSMPKQPERPVGFHAAPGGAWCLSAFFELVDLVRAHVHECQLIRCKFCDELYPTHISEGVQWYIDTGELDTWQGSFFPDSAKSLDEVKERPT